MGGGKDFVQGGGKAVEVFWGVGGGEEADLVGRGGQGDAAFQEGVEDGGVAVDGITADGLCKARGLGVGEGDPEDGAEADEACAVSIKDGGEDRVEVCAQFGEGLPAAGAVELVEGGEAGRHRDRVPAEGAGLVDGAVGGEHIHDLGGATEGADGQAAADDLAEGGEVGRDAEQLRGSARARTSVV